MNLSGAFLLFRSRRENRQSRNRISSRAGLLLLPVLLCSCTSFTGKTVRHEEPSQPTINGLPIPTINGGSRADELAQAEPQPAPVLTPTPAPAAPGVVRIQKQPPAMQPGTIQQVSGNVPVAQPVPPGYPMPEFTPSVARVPVMPHLTPEQLAEMYPDEYLWDGGDRALPVHYDPFFRHGLNTQDTIVEYTDERGKTHMKPTNEVAIYAPRFASVRTISTPVEGSLVNQAFGNQALIPGAGLKGQMVLSAEQKSLNPAGMLMRSRASGVDTLATEEGLTQATRFGNHTKLENLYQELTFLKSGEFDTTQNAQLGMRIQAAQHWGKAENTVIVGSTSAQMEVYAASKPMALVGLEQKKAPGDLRIVKLADKQEAAPGDIVTFTIRYDNLGDEDLFHVRIIDNLTPRLEYVEDSADSDQPGRLDVVDNEEGSLILKFILEEPLKGRTGGVVTFQCRVR